MGMFDDLVIDKVHLPNELKDYENGWQTKSLDSGLFTFIIDESGQLLQEVWLHKHKKSLVKQKYTGEIRFYTTIDNVWHEFVAFVEKGVLLKLIKISE
jgi:hypothetical protein